MVSCFLHSLEFLLRGSVMVFGGVAMVFDGMGESAPSSTTQVPDIVEERMR